MFGLNEITWKVFLLFITSGLLMWYLAILVFAWLKTRGSKTALYEEPLTGNSKSGKLNPISVSSHQFSSQLLSAMSESAIPFEVLRYEERGDHDGLNLSLFLEDNNGELAQQLPHIQYQQ